MPDDSCQRALYIGREVNDGFDETRWGSPEDALRYAQLASDFDRFSSGDMINVGWDPFDKKDNAFMARIDPPEYGVWDIRSMAPKPALRAFGGFLETDTFIALKVCWRSDLGGRTSREWDSAREGTLALWAELFEGLKPKTGGTYSEYISQAAIPC